MRTVTHSKLCSRSIKMKKPLQIRDIVLAAMLAAILIAAKELLAWLPNVELVTTLLILYTLHFPHLTPFIIYIFVGVECCLYGLNLWVWMYLYIWIILYFIVRLLHSAGSRLLWVVVAAAFGMLFGLLCSPVYWVLSGWKTAAAWFMAGIPFDLLHGISNGIVTLVLFGPLNALFTRLKQKGYT